MGATTSAELRAHNRARLLRAVHDCGASRTRSQLTRDLELARGTASVLVGELATDALLHEEPSEGHGRGRPTQIPGPHQDGPVVLAADLREDQWEIAACELGGRMTALETSGHDGTPSGVLGPLGAALRRFTGPRVVGVGLAVAGPVRHDSTVDIAHLGWGEVDLSEPLGLSVPLLVGNDARLAGLAEVRRGRLQGVGVGLHLHVDFDLGGTLLVGGSPLTGASGTSGEFGHMPMGGDPSVVCMCGARGCWGQLVGSNALLRAFGMEAGYGRGREEAERILVAAARGDAAAMAAVTENARALGAGAGALVNALDPEAVTLSGTAVEVFILGGTAVREAYVDGLMAFRRSSPPPISTSALGRRGPLIGAMESVFDAFLTPEGVEGWRAKQAS